jgi:predicted nucleic acid-binding protein
MAFLLDSGILLRLANPQDIRHREVRSAVSILGDRGEPLHAATQNIAEFCNVISRPIENNGLGKTPQEAVRFVREDIEPICGILIEMDFAYSEFKRLVSNYSVVGKQVHDARLVAMMLAWQIENILTLNDRDFRRYEPEGINIVTPAELMASA